MGVGRAGALVARAPAETCVHTFRRRMNTRARLQTRARTHTHLIFLKVVSNEEALGKMRVVVVPGVRRRGRVIVRDWRYKLFQREQSGQTKSAMLQQHNAFDSTLMGRQACTLAH